MLKANVKNVAPYSDRLPSNGQSHNWRSVGLFAGVGGFELGLSRGGFSTPLLCEIHPAAQAVLRSRFPDSTIVPDVRDIDILPKGTSVLCAGFPCQDLSSVGQKVGIHGKRSSLVGEVFRILRNDPVEWVIIENVKFMLHLRKGAAIREIISNLEELGYRWAYRVINSHSFGIPHRRHRVFFVASLNHDPRWVLLSEDAGLAKRRTCEAPVPYGFYWTEGTYAVGLAENAIPPLKNGSTIGIPSPPAILFPDGLVGTPDIRDAERFQGFPADWTKPAEVASRASARWGLVGNAVTVPVSEWLGKRLRKPLAYDDSNDTPIVDRWPEAAWSLGSGRYTSNVSEWPVRVRTPGITSFLKYPVKPLSLTATAGFLKRARAGNLMFPDGFLGLLEEHCRSRHCTRSSVDVR